MLLDAQALFLAFTLVIILCISMLRLLGGARIPFFLYSLIAIQLASSIAIVDAINAAPFLKSIVYIECLYFICCSSIARRINTKENPIISQKRYNPNAYYYTNIILSLFFIPIFLKNIIESNNPHADRIVSLQGLGFLYYPHSALALGIVVLYLAKCIKHETRSNAHTIAALFGFISLLLTGGRFLPLMVIAGLMVMINFKHYKSAKYFSSLIFVLGLIYFNFFSSSGTSFLQNLGYRLFNSSDIIYYLNDPKSIDDIIKLYPYNIFDLLLNPFQKLINASHVFQGPGPFLFQGEGQGPLPSFFFDGFFYFGYLGYVYLLIIPPLYWYVISKAIIFCRSDSDGGRLFSYCILFLPTLSLTSDLATWNGLFYGLFVVYVFSKVPIKSFLKKHYQATSKPDPLATELLTPGGAEEVT